MSGAGFQFGNNLNTNKPLFGSTPSNTTSGGLFGNNTNTTGGFGTNNSTTGGGLFGSNNTASKPNSTPIFGGNTNTSSSGSNLFGNANTNTNTAGGGLFGKNNNTTSTSGLFNNNNNNTNANTTGGGLFGSNNNSNVTGTTGGLFGNNNTTNNTGGSLFGSKPATNTGTSLFGGNNTTNTNTGGGLFGGNNAANTNTGGGLFSGNQNNNTTGNGLFGNQNASTNSGNAFGAGANTNSASAGLFGNAISNNNQLNQSQQLQQSQMQPQFPVQQDPNQYLRRNNGEPSILEQLGKIQSAWDPASPQCAFQFFFYNKVSKQEALLHEKPAAIEQSKWDEAIEKRPDDSYVPALAIGFTDLQKRIKVQDQTVALYQQRMHEINDKLVALCQKHDLTTTVKFSQMKMRHEKLVHRTLSLAAKIQVLRSRGYVLRPDEEVLKKKLESLIKQIDDPAVFGRINEIWARLTVLSERARSLASKNGRLGTAGFGSDDDDLNNGGNDADRNNGDDDAVRAMLTELDWNRDEEQLEKLAKVLKEQQEGISFLAEVLQKDTAQVDDIIEDLIYGKNKVKSDPW